MTSMAQENIMLHRLKQGSELNGKPTNNTQPPQSLPVVDLNVEETQLPAKLVTPTEPPPPEIIRQNLQAQDGMDTNPLCFTNVYSSFTPVERDDSDTSPTDSTSIFSANESDTYLHDNFDQFRCDLAPFAYTNHISDFPDWHTAVTERTQIPSPPSQRRMMALALSKHNQKQKMDANMYAMIDPSNCVVTHHHHHHYHW